MAVDFYFRIINSLCEKFLKTKATLYNVNATSLDDKRF